MADLAQHMGTFEERNARLAVIGSGEPRHFPEFREKTGYEGPLFSDPSLDAYSALGFSSNISGLMSVKSVFKVASALTQGHRPGTIQGRSLQNGGCVVIDPAGNIPYYFAEKKAGEHPKIADLIQVL